MHLRIVIAFVLLWTIRPLGTLQAQDADQLLRKVRQKMDQVRDYTAKGSLKTDVSFLRIPVSKVQVWYKQPNKFKIQKDGGISLLPKGGISVNLNALMATGEFMAVAAGETQLGGKTVKIVKMLPLKEGADVVLSTLYIDEEALLIRRAVTTTRENGTYDMSMQYGKYASLGLPDKVVVSFDTKDYKLPKGVTFEYDAGAAGAPAEKPKGPQKGKVEITYASYQVNTGLTDASFK